MKKTLIFILLLCPMLAFGQTFYVNTSCHLCDKRIIKKLNRMGYLTTKDSLQATYKIAIFVKKDRNYISIKVKHQKSGYLKFINQENKVVDSTRFQKGDALLQNGFDARAMIVRKVLKRDFSAIVKELPKK